VTTKPIKYTTFIFF